MNIWRRTKQVHISYEDELALSFWVLQEKECLDSKLSPSIIQNYVNIQSCDIHDLNDYMERTDFIYSLYIHRKTI